MAGDSNEFRLNHGDDVDVNDELLLFFVLLFPNISLAYVFWPAEGELSFICDVLVIEKCVAESSIIGTYKYITI